MVRYVRTRWVAGLPVLSRLRQPRDPARPDVSHHSARHGDGPLERRLFRWTGAELSRPVAGAGGPDHPERDHLRLAGPDGNAIRAALLDRGRDPHAVRVRRP